MRRAEAGVPALPETAPAGGRAAAAASAGDSLVVLRPRRTPGGMEPVPREEKPNPLQDASLCSRLFFW